jgi:hypothetical protein
LLAVSFFITNIVFLCQVKRYGFLDVLHIKYPDRICLKLIILFDEKQYYDKVKVVKIEVIERLLVN